MSVYLSAFLEATYCKTRAEHISIYEHAAMLGQKEPFCKGLTLTLFREHKLQVAIFTIYHP